MKTDEWSHHYGDLDEDLTREAQKAREGDLLAFEQLILRYQGRVAANCRYITGDRNNFEDLSQEVLVKAFFAIRSFDGTSSFWVWLQRIKLSHCLKHLEEQSGRTFIGITEPDVDQFDELQVPLTPEALAGAISDKQLIGTVLDSMSSGHRIPLLLCDMDELTYEEIARLMGITLSATKMRIKRARDEFRELYQSFVTTGIAMRAK
jgi:RNA polymerase sigma-70 factor, ECF subfamily